MFKQEYIDAMNEALINAARETESLFKDGSEDEIMFQIEKHRKVYLWLKEKGIEVAKERNLKKLKEQGEASVQPNKRLLQPNKAKSKGRKTQTKDERLTNAFSRLGIDPKEMAKRLKQK